MARPKNADESVVLQVSVFPSVRDWLAQLAGYGVYGKNATAVAEHFVREGVERALKGEGLLRNPPPQPRPPRTESQRRRS